MIKKILIFKYWQKVISEVVTDTCNPRTLRGEDCNFESSVNYQFSETLVQDKKQKGWGRSLVPCSYLGLNPMFMPSPLKIIFVG